MRGFRGHGWPEQLEALGSREGLAGAKWTEEMRAGDTEEGHCPISCSLLRGPKAQGWGCGGEAAGRPSWRSAPPNTDRPSGLSGLSSQVPWWPVILGNPGREAGLRGEGRGERRVGCPGAPPFAPPRLSSLAAMAKKGGLSVSPMPTLFWSGPGVRKAAGDPRQGPDGAGQGAEGGGSSVPLGGVRARRF